MAWALGISLRQFFTIYPSSCPNMDTVHPATSGIWYIFVDFMLYCSLHSNKKQIQIQIVCRRQMTLMTHTNLFGHILTLYFLWFCPWLCICTCAFFSLCPTLVWVLSFLHLIVSPLWYIIWNNMRIYPAWNGAPYILHFFGGLMNPFRV